MLKEEMEPGPHAVTWDGTVDGRRGSAGVYFARLQVSGSTEARQIHRKVVIRLAGPAAVERLDPSDGHHRLAGRSERE